MMIFAKRWFVLFLIFVAGVLAVGFINTDSSLNSAWKKSDNGIRESNILSIASYPHHSGVLLAGTEKALYRSEDGGAYFRCVFQVPASEKAVSYLYIYGRAPYTAYAATQSGLFTSDDLGVTWKKIFLSGNDLERQCLSVFLSDKKIYLGTEGGLFSRGYVESEWRKEKGRLSNSAIYSISYDGQYVYCANENEIYRIDETAGETRRVFSLIAQENNGDYDTDSDYDYDSDEIASQIKEIIFDARERLIYTATTKGIFLSSNAGESWDRIPNDGIPFDEITSLLVVNREDIYVSTLKGVFHFQNKAWQPLYKGIHTNTVNFLNRDAEGRLYAATDSGLFRFGLNGNKTGLLHIDYGEIEKRFRVEPNIRVVQEMAIDYAEVNSDKIKEWRRLAKKRAWMPKVTIGADGDKNRTIADSLWGSYSGGGQHYMGPDDKTFYDNFGWDISFSWELGDLIWSTDQTSIDSRSKLMVELREDVLDEVTRLYFERRRLQAEFLSTDKDSSPDLFDKQIRIEELTALIDAFTGGDFSREIEAKKQSHGHQVTTSQEGYER